MEHMHERVPVKTIEQPGRFEIWNIEDLPTEEMLAALDAIEVYKQSTNPEFHAGACAVAFNGEKSVKHNHTSEPGKGQKGHAEMLALQALFQSPTGRRLKIMALAAAYPDQELFRSEDKYETGSPIENVNEIDMPRICGRCLKMMSDYSGNNLPGFKDENGVPSEAWDPIILIVTGTRQVMRTTLSALHPLPHIPHQTDIRPWEESDKDKQSKSPDNINGK